MSDANGYNGNGFNAPYGSDPYAQQPQNIPQQDANSYTAPEQASSGDAAFDAFVQQSNANGGATINFGDEGTFAAPQQQAPVSQPAHAQAPQAAPAQAPYDSAAPQDYPSQAQSPYASARPQNPPQSYGQVSYGQQQFGQASYSEPAQATPQASPAQASYQENTASQAPVFSQAPAAQARYDAASYGQQNAPATPAPANQVRYGQTAQADASAFSASQASFTPAPQESLTPSAPVAPAPQVAAPAAAFTATAVKLPAADKTGGYSDKAGTGIHNSHTRRVIADVLSYILLGVLSVIWVMPILWIFLESFNAEQGATQRTFFPTQYTFSNYTKLFTDTGIMNFPSMFARTFIIACFVCVIQVLFVLLVAYSMSRMRFRFRKPFMNIVLVLGMFPGIMSVVAIYFILKALNLTTGNWTVVALILVYSAGSGAGFYMMKGYMDTIPTSLDEAAMIDGCTRWQVFYKIILPICRPMIVYQAITAFLAPWLDFVMAKAICRTQDQYTVALGLYQMLQKEYITQWYTRFAAGAVVVSIPIAVLFMVMQNFYQESMAGSVKG